MSNKTCFIITPVGQPDSETRRSSDGLYLNIIKPLLETMEYEVSTSHLMYDAGSITDQIMESLLNADIVIANLTELNPNVMYELGVRHSAAKPVVVISLYGTKIPFDVSIERTILFKNDFQGAEELKNGLKQAIALVMSDKDSVDNPVYRAKHRSIIKELIKDQNPQSAYLAALERISNQISNLSFRTQQKPSRLSEWTTTAGSSHVIDSSAQNMGWGTSLLDAIAYDQTVNGFPEVDPVTGLIRKKK